MQQVYEYQYLVYQGEVDYFSLVKGPGIDKDYRPSCQCLDTTRPITRQELQLYLDGDIVEPEWLYIP